MKRNILIIITIVSTIFLMGNSAMALHIDFTDASTFKAAHNNASFTTTIDNLDVTLNAHADKPNAKLGWFTKDGIGVMSSYEADEIEADEQLELAFGSTVRLEGLYLTDFFVESRGGNTYAELGSFTLYGSDFSSGKLLSIEAYSPTKGTNGEFYMAFDETLFVDRIVFESLGRINGEDHEYSLAGVDVSMVNTDPVPEPTTMVLMSLGLMGLFWLRRSEGRVLAWVRKR